MHAYFGVHLVAKTSFNLPPTVVLQQALSVRRARTQSPKTACPKMAMSIIMIPKTLHTSFHTSVLTFGLLHGGLASLGHISKIYLSPDHSS
jgi:hypothetical protein